MDSDTSKINRIIDFIGMFHSFAEIQKEWHLNHEELEVLKQKAEERYGRPVFKN